MWDKGEGAVADVDLLDVVLDELERSACADKPGEFAQHLGELVFDALALAGALGIDITLEVERCRKLQAKVGK